GLTRIADVLEHGGHLAQVRRTAIVVPFAVLGGGVPGLLVGRQLVTSDAGATSTGLVGVLCGRVGALASAGLMAATAPEATRRLLARVRAGRHGTVTAQP